MREVEVIRANRKISERTAGKIDDILRVAPYARVSTDSEEQLSSYKSQVMYYKDLVNSRKEWVLVDIYADESITGTQVARRENFQRMINDCMDGKIDMIITKSISRFARNTLDTLKYVRMLKERNIAVFFEEENINTMTMDSVEGYTSKVEGYDVTNSYAPGKTSVQVTKSWQDQNNQDGKRPENVTVKLLANGKATEETLTLTKDNNWTGTFTDLDEYKDGEKIVYTVEEVKVNGYETEVTGDQETGFIVTNSHEVEKINIEGKKTWEDQNNQDGKRPESITIRLLANGNEVANKEVTAEDWTWKFENLDKFENGEEIVYTITEDSVEGYTSKVEGYDVTNSYAPGKTSVQVTKSWQDQNNQDGKRPENVTVKLLANGKATEETLTLTKDNNWTGTFTDLDEYKDGEKIVYTVEEVKVNGYETEITGDKETGFIITNIRKKPWTPEDPDKPDKPNKPEKPTPNTPKEPSKNLPKTGDGFNPIVYASVMVLAGGVLTLIGIKRRKKYEE